MQKYPLLILTVLFAAGTAFAQAPEQRADISYSERAIRIDYSPSMLPLEKTAIDGKEFVSIGGYFDESRSGERALPQEVITVAIPPGSSPRIVVSNAEYTPVSGLPPVINPRATIVGDTVVEYTWLTEVSAPSPALPAAEIEGFGWVRDYYCVYIRINRYRFDETASKLSALAKVSLALEFPGGLRQPLLKQAASAADPIADRLVINSSTAGGWRTAPPVPDRILTAHDWLDPASTYVKLRTGHDGIHRITGADLQQLGIDIGSIQPGTLKLYESGEEVPVHVQSGPAFGTGDYVEFYGHRNYTGDAYRTQTGTDVEYIPYLDRYNDSTTFWLTWGGEDGLRFADYSLPAPADTTSTYRHLEHMEDDIFLMYGDASSVGSQFPNWINKWWAFGGMKVQKRDFEVPVAEPVPGTSATVRFKFQSAAYSPGFSPTHVVAAYINGAAEPVDSTAIDQLQIGILDAEFPSSEMTEGTTTISIENRKTASPGNSIVYDWLELEYARELIPAGDRLTFHIDNSITSASQSTVLLKGFTTEDVVVYKTAPEPRRYTALNTAQSGGAYNVWFGDELSGDDRYAASSADSVLTPAFVAVRSPGRNPFAGLSAVSNAADYIIVSHPGLQPASQQYADFIASRYGVNVRLVEVDDVMDEFAYGYFKPEGIRDFLQYAYGSWQRPGPQYVLFLGDASYDYKNALERVDPNYKKLERTSNLVPSYGLPVGDAMMVLWDESERKALPQMMYGRIPAVTPADILGYMQRHAEYLDAENTEWNKRYLLFTGGLESRQFEMEQLRLTNRTIRDESILPPPVAGTADHFYKTVNPSSSFGPSDPDFVTNSIAQGAVLISYLGHSGTQTWDNSISQPSQLKNAVDRYSIITDFGCSTAKFAENDVISFSELFTLGPDANAIAYVGNSSLGTLPVTQTLSRYFYRSVLQDTVHTLGMAHLRSKQIMFQLLSSSDVFRIAARTNTLIGDPILRVAVPDKPNFVLRESEVVMLDGNLTEGEDSVRFMMTVRNHGSAVQPPLEIRIRHTNSDTLVGERAFTVPSPGFKDTVFFALPVRNLKGLHRFTVSLDPNNQFEEIIESDNEASGQFAVASASVTHLAPVSPAAVYDDEIVVMNPVFAPAGGSSTLHVEISPDPGFGPGVTVTRPVPFDTVVTRIPVSDFSADQRYYYRYRLDPAEEWMGPYTFFRLEEDAKRGYLDSVSLGGGTRNFYLRNDEIITRTEEVDISLVSAGFSAGKYAIINYDGLNLVSGDQIRGYYLTVLDGTTKEVKSETKNYDPFDTPNFLDSLTAFLGRIADGDVLLITIADAGTPGESVWAALKNALYEFGSSYIDSVRVRDSWAMVGVKGAAQGTANERYVRRETFNIAQLDTTFTVELGSALFMTDAIGPAGRWKQIRKSIANGEVRTSVMGITAGLGTDTLQSMVPDAVQDLSAIDAGTYPSIRLDNVIAGTLPGIAPSGLKMTVAYDLPAELALNYQTVWMENDQVAQGNDARAVSRVFNAGELPASDIAIEYYLLTPSNEKKLIKEVTVPALLPGGAYTETLSIPTDDFAGNAAFIVEVDNAGSVREITRSNNAFTVPFTVLGDTTRPSLDVTIDGIMPFDGDYVSARPDVVVKLFDTGELPVEDVSSFLVYLNDTLVVNNPDYDVEFQPGSGEEKATLTFKPVLEDGTHFFKFNALDASGNRAFDEDMEIMVIVETESKLFDLYNVPNPLTDHTSFTFTLTGTEVPQEFEIKVYTIAGRLIRDIRVPPSQLRIGYNNIKWDGRDEDGDLIANGTYLYKVAYTMSTGRQYVLGKLAVLR